MTELIKRVYLPEDVAPWFHVDARTVTRWCATGRVPGAFRTPGGHFRIPQSALDALLNQQTDERPTP